MRQTSRTTGTGANDNNSWNCGAEGETDDPGIRRLRIQQMRNFLSTLFLSQGMPMLLMGDEVGRSQGGNHNAYCQDSEIGWFDWGAVEGEGHDLLEFTKMLIRLRHEHIVFRRSRFFTGSIIPGTDVKDVTWLRPDGQEMGGADWQNPIAKAIVLLLSGEAGLTYLTEKGEPELDDTFVMILNASHVDVEVTLPERPTTSAGTSRSTARPRTGWGTRPARSARRSTRSRAPSSSCAAPRPRRSSYELATRYCSEALKQEFSISNAIKVESDEHHPGNHACRGDRSLWRS